MLMLNTWHIPICMFAALLLNRIQGHNPSPAPVIANVANAIAGPERRHRGHSTNQARSECRRNLSIQISCRKTARRVSTTFRTSESCGLSKVAEESDQSASESEMRLPPSEAEESFSCLMGLMGHILLFGVMVGQHITSSCPRHQLGDHQTTRSCPRHREQTCPAVEQMQLLQQLANSLDATPSATRQPMTS